MTVQTKLIPWLMILAACSSSSDGGVASDSGIKRDTSSPASDAGHDAPPDATRDASHDASGDVSDVSDVGVTSDAPVPTMALVRLANWSPDAPGLDFCVSPHATSNWSGPVLAAAHPDAGVLGTLTVVDAGIPVDAGTAKHDASASLDAGVSLDATADASKPDGHVIDSATDVSSSIDAGPDAVAPSGVTFLRMSPYAKLNPGDYDVRLVAAGATDCTTPLAADVDDFPQLVAGTVLTLAAVGDTVDEGSDPSLYLTAFADDTTVAASKVALRFINAVPSVIGVTFASGTIAKGTNTPYLSAAQFGSAGVDTVDGGVIDPNNYLVAPPITSTTWSLINANGGITTLAAVIGPSIPAGSIATVVGVGGESGPDENAIGILVCIDKTVDAGETAVCELFEEGSDPACVGCL